MVMYVVKRNKTHEPVAFDKITARITNLCWGLDPAWVDPLVIAQRVVSGIFNGVETEQLDKLAAETSASFATRHPDFSKLAARIEVSNLHKKTNYSFSELAKKLHSYIHPITHKPAGLLADDVFDVIMANAEVLDAAIDYQRDFEFDYFGFMTLAQSYLLQLDGTVAERPQHMWMRVAVGIHKSDIRAAIETYNCMSTKQFIHATPTLFNAGTPKPQMSSCFLLTMKEDSIDGIFDTLKSCAIMSKYAGGIGLSVQDVRAQASYIAGTNGTSNGLVPMLRVFNDTARYVDQGGGKRKGSFAIYLEPWHSDIFEVLELRKNFGKEEERARDLFYAMWVPDLFMQRVKDNANWSLFCPNEAPGLSNVHSQEFNDLYQKYEAVEGLARKTIKARALFELICKTQIETGMPYMMYKDACNRKSNQQNLGTIKSSNLCTEIVEFSSADQTAVCNLASINLSVLVDKPYTAEAAFNFEKLVQVTGVVVRNLNKVVDTTYYPVPESKFSNLLHRPVGVGVQGLADTFAMMRMPFESEEALKLNNLIFESLYYGAVVASVELAKVDGPYSTFANSPMSQGKFQFDLWNVKPSARYDWEELRGQVVKHGIRNSLLVAPMPTASTSQILGNNECFEAFTSNMYARRVLAGDFVVINKHMLRDLVEAKCWTDAVKNQVIADGGSIQNVACISPEIKALYKTVWEISQKAVLQMAAGRGPFICQSQSMNVHLPRPTTKQIESMHFFGWKLGLKTGMYYLRTRPKAEPIKFTVDQQALASSRQDTQDTQDTQDNEGNPNVQVIQANQVTSELSMYGAPQEECLMCGS